ncbi:hypothetical protein RchiOBHm_Chr2g0087241 [Rosa chinensis]|uniref:Uncharacterized protein n=1 Tax=Rosa chinensis TaxID=74649 RepID=A0A2P6RIK9_ROSCH|nr:hypothetical protein RchiOBHm_Chr2g0087241 [Rosa chinensis]
MGNIPFQVRWFSTSVIQLWYSEPVESRMGKSSLGSFDILLKRRKYILVSEFKFPQKLK